MFAICRNDLLTSPLSIFSRANAVMRIGSTLKILNKLIHIHILKRVYI